VRDYSNNGVKAVEFAIASVADRWHGNIAHEQLLALGLSRGQIAYRVRDGRLYPGPRGVYGVGRPAKTALERAAAAVLACGPGAALSDHAALALWGFGRWPQRFDVVVPGNRRPKGIKVHRPKGLIGRDFRTHQEIRVTSPARTLLDCAPTLTDKALKRAYNDLRRSDHARLRPHHLQDVIDRFPNHPGVKRLKPLLEVKGGPTRSEWEDAFPAFCKQYGLPEPVLSTPVAGHEADALFEEERIVIELDSWGFHNDKEAFESDRDRDVDRLVAGFVTVRITWPRIKYRSAREAARLHELVRQRRAT
jgi:hypothetical protein